MLAALGAKGQPGPHWVRAIRLTRRVKKKGESRGRAVVGVGVDQSQASTTTAP
jgi:hypothetical protein